MAILAYALPVVPGQEDRLRRFPEELAAHQADYEELNRLGTVRQHLAFLQATPAGSLLITAFEVDDPSRLLRAFGDSAYDQWWLDYLRDVNGVDVRSGPAAALPELVFAWAAD